MPEITVDLMQSFVDSGMGGNTAGIVYPADHLTSVEKQFIATSVGISEIAFISRSQVAAYKLEFFTPNKQIPHCGHATIAAFCYLREHDQLPNGESSKETIDGVRKIIIDGQHTFMQQLKPEYHQIQDYDVKLEDLLWSLNLDQTQIDQQEKIRIVNTGNAFLILPLKDIAALQAILPNQNEIYWLSEKMNIIGFYPFVLLEKNSPHQASTRMFAPRFGVSEESATGTAAGPLAAYLYDYSECKQTNYTFEQGHWMKHPSPSLIQVQLSLENDQIAGMMVGGSAVLAGKRHLTW
jgi:PhzF family phenazine biosynthesis protein